MNPLKTILQLYDSFSISKKFLVTLVLISILPILLLLAISFAVVTVTMQNQVDQFTSSHLEQAYYSVDGQFNSYQEILTDVSSDRIIIENLKDLNVWSQQYNVSARDIRERLRDIAFAERGILGLYVFANNGETAYYDTISLSNVEAFCLDPGQVSQSDLYRETIQSREVVYGGAKHITHPQYGEKNIIYMSKRIVDLNNLQKGPIGAIFLAVDEEYLENIYTQRTGELDSSFITDTQGEILSFPHKQYIGRNIYGDAGADIPFDQAVKEFASQTGLWGTKGLLVSSISKPESNFIVVDVLNERAIFGNIRVMSVLIILVGIGTIGFSIVVIHYTSKKINKSVRNIVDAMHQSQQKNFDAHVNVEGNDEFAYIGTHFNTMISEIKRLTARENQALHRQREAELQALEAQINPHFIYNTLDAINWIAIEHGEHSISQMLKNLASILRYSIHNSIQFVKLSQDMEYIKKYIFLQQKRFSYSFECLIKMDDEAKEVPVHKLLIQPLIENSLRHGFPGPTGMDQIKILIRLEEKMLSIRVEDNGVGMSGEQIDYFNGYDYERDHRQSSIGIRNVIARIKMYYGPDARFVIAARPGGGTVIRIEIPVSKTGEETERYE